MFGIRRESSVQRQAFVRGLLQPGESFDMTTGQYLSPSYPAGRRRIKTFSERVEQIMSKLGMIKHMDDAWFQDTRGPFTAADIASVTLASTNKALYPIANFPVLGSNYWKFIGKKLRIELFGRITTVLTPGNGQWAVFWGTGADANGSSLQTSTAAALTASQTNLSWYANILVTCRGFGAAGSLLATGFAFFNEAVQAPKQLIPASAPAQSGSIDLTAANIVSVQYNRSGSTAETMQVHDGVVTSLN